MTMQVLPAIPAMPSLRIKSRSALFAPEPVCAGLLLCENLEVRHWTSFAASPGLGVGLRLHGCGSLAGIQREVRRHFLGLRARDCGQKRDDENPFMHVRAG